MKKAFTLLELVFVIAVVGILAAIIIPNTRTNPLREAAIQLVSHIRYTQHLAMVDDKFAINDADWYKKRWQLIFGKSADTNHQVAYSIYSDAAGLSGNPGISEFALDPMSSDKFLSGGSSGSLLTNDSRANKKMNLGLSYGIDSVILSGGCGGVRLSFDYLGRPIQGTIHNSAQSYESSDMIDSRCNITLTDNNTDSIIIAVESESGYAHILD